MTAEEKARAYDEALERAKSAVKNCGDNNGRIAMIESIFPVLYQSDDERIRKDIISFLHSKNEYGYMTPDEDLDFHNRWLPWLEKQKELTSDEEKQGKEDVLWCINQAKKHAKDENEMGTCWFAEKWLEKQGGSVKWQKNTPENKPPKNHSVLMKTVDGIAEGEWQGEHWIQYRWSGILKDSDVLYWMELSELEKLGKEEQQ